MINAEFFDIFGLISFIYITAISILILKKKRIPKSATIILLMIGIFGILIDGFIVIKTYLIK